MSNDTITTVIARPVSVQDDCWITRWAIEEDKTGIFADAVLTIDWRVRKAAQYAPRVIQTHMPINIHYASRYDEQEFKCRYRIHENDVRGMVDQLKILQQDGFLIPNIGELYLLRCRWYNHPFSQKRFSCDKDSLILITDVDQGKRTCTAVLSDGNENYYTNSLSFLGLHIMTRRMEEVEERRQDNGI